MTHRRALAERAFDRVADRVASAAWDELDPVRVATDGRRTGDTLGLGVERRLAKRVLQGPIRREMRRLDAAWTRQYHGLLDDIVDADGAASRAGGTTDGARERFVGADPFLEHYAGSENDAFVAALADHHERLQRSLAPILATGNADRSGDRDIDGFWDLAVAVHGEDATRDLLDALAGHRDILARFGDDVRMTMPIRVPVFSEQEVDYGHEAVRVIRHGIAEARAAEERRLERVMAGD